MTDVHCEKKNILMLRMRKSYAKQEHPTKTHNKYTLLRRNHFCEECGKVLSSKNILQKHLTDIHCEIKLFCCKECGKDIPSKSILQRHTTNIHCEEENIFCEACGKFM